MAAAMLYEPAYAAQFARVSRSGLHCLWDGSISLVARRPDLPAAIAIS